MDGIESFINSKLNQFKQNFAPAIQNVENFAAPIVKTIASQPLLNNQLPGIGPIQPKVPFSPTIGQYAQGNVINPISQGVKSLTAPTSNLAQRGIGALQIAGGAFGATPQGALFNVGQGGAAGVLQSLRTKQNPNKLIAQGMSQPTGIGTTGLGLKGIPGAAVDIGAGFAPGAAGTLVSKGADLIQGLKGINPKAFAMHPEDIQDAKNALDVLKGFEKGDKGDAMKTVQNLLEAYAPGYKNSKNADAYKVLENLVANNEGEQMTKLPQSMGLVGNKDIGVEPVEQAKSLVQNLKAGTNKPLSFPEEMDQLQGKTIPQEPPMPKLSDAGDITNPPIAETAPKEVANQARQAGFETKQNIDFRAKNLSQQMKNVLKTPEDNMNFRLALEDPKGIEAYAQKSSNSQAFKFLANKYSDFTDFVLGQAQDKKIPLNNVQDYFTHIWDLSTPEARAKYDDILNYNAKNFQSGFTKGRLVATFKQGLAAGLQFKNPNASDDVLQYANSMGKQISNQAFNNKINELRPGGAVEDVTGAATRNSKFQPFLQSNRPGNESTFIDPEIQRNMSFYNKSGLAESPLIGGKDVQIGDKTLHVPGVDQINQIIKQSKLGGGGFHALNTTLREIVNDPLTIPTAVHNFIDDGANRAFQQKAIDEGVIDFGSKSGVTFDTSGDIGKMNESLLSKAASQNPITKFSNRMFSNLIGTYKINLVRGMMNKFDLSNPEDLAKAQEYGSQINNLMGGINYEALGRSKTVQQAFRLIGLAPDFSEGTLKQLTSALNPAEYLNPTTKPAAIFALRQVVGQVMLYAGLAELGRRITTGAFSPDFKSFVANSILKPNIPLPNNSTFNSPKTNKPQSAFLPSSEAQTMMGAVNDPAHFLQARGSGIVSLGGSLLSGKDYYGNPLVNPFNGTPDNMVNRLKATIPGQLPIPIQQGLKAAIPDQTTKSGAKVPTQTPAATALNIAGLRVGNNPSTPEAQATTAYFKSLNDAANALDPNEKNKFLGLLHPTTKDANGNPVVDKTPLTTPAQYDTLLADPKLLSAEVNFQKSQASHDPLWDLTPSQLKSYMQAQVISKNNPTSYLGINDPTVKTLYASLPQDFFTKRSAFFQGLQNQGVQLSSTSQPNTEPTDIQNWFTQHNKLATPKDKAIDWQSPMGQKASAYLQQQANLTNQQRADMGLPLIAQASGGSSSGGGYSSAQKAYIRRTIRQVAKPRPRKAPLARLPKSRKSKVTKLRTVKFAKVENPSKGKLKLKT